MKTILEVQNLTHRFQSENLFSGIHFQLMQNESIAIVGPSGCGKSTLLRLLAGFLKPSSGQIIKDDSLQEKIGFVFQESTLLPWLNVQKNTELPLQLSGRTADVDQWIQLVGLSLHVQKFPHELSGGMKMRASIARALVLEPKLLLLDEPFSALDENTREKLIHDFQSLQKKLQFSSVFVTHSLAEALLLSDRILILNKYGHCIGEYSPQINRFKEKVEYTPEFQQELFKLKEAFRKT